MTATASPPTQATRAVVPVIRLDDVHKTFGSGALAVHALRGADVTIAPGQFVVVLGPSGSGKTTLINVIGGIEPATSGRILVKDVEVNALDERALTGYRREQVGFVFQFFNLIPTLTARENVALVGELVGADDSAAVESLEQVGLGDKIDRFPSSLSGGEQQRVAIARALANDPYVLLADEPTGNLDDRATRGIMDLFWDINAKGMAVLMATHDMEILKRHPHARVFELDSGALVYDSAEG